MRLVKSTYQNGGLFGLLERQRARINRAEQEQMRQEAEAAPTMFSFDLAGGSSPSVDYSRGAEGISSVAQPRDNVLFYQTSKAAGSPYAFAVKTSDKKGKGGYTTYSSLAQLENAFNSPDAFTGENAQQLRAAAINQFTEQFPTYMDDKGKVRFDLSAQEERTLSRSPKENVDGEMTSQDIFGSFLLEISPEDAESLRRTKRSTVKVGPRTSSEATDFGNIGRGEGKVCPGASLWCPEF
jgi:hypothetical protein